MTELCVVKERGNHALYLYSDADNILIPSLYLPASTYKSGQRYRVTYVKLEGVASLNDDNEVVVEIQDLLPVLIKDVVKRESLSGVLSDPIWLVNRPSFGGGYLNLEFRYYNDEGSNIMHTIQLVQDSISKKKVYMTFGHNANGDLSQKSVTALASFPLTTMPDIQFADSLIVTVLEGTKQKVYRISADY